MFHLQILILHGLHRVRYCGNRAVTALSAPLRRRTVLRSWTERPLISSPSPAPGLCLLTLGDFQQPLTSRPAFGCPWSRRTSSPWADSLLACGASVSSEASGSSGAAGLHPSTCGLASTPATQRLVILAVCLFTVSLLGLPLFQRSLSPAVVAAESLLCFYHSEDGFFQHTFSSDTPEVPWETEPQAKSRAGLRLRGGIAPRCGLSVLNP